MLLHSLADTEQDYIIRGAGGIIGVPLFLIFCFKVKIQLIIYVSFGRLTQTRHIMSFDSPKQPHVANVPPPFFSYIPVFLYGKLLIRALFYKQIEKKKVSYMMLMLVMVNQNQQDLSLTFPISHLYNFLHNFFFFFLTKRSQISSFCFVIKVLFIHYITIRFYSLKFIKLPWMFDSIIQQLKKDAYIRIHIRKKKQKRKCSFPVAFQSCYS